MDNEMKRTSSNLFDYKQFMRLMDKGLQRQDSDKENSLQQLLDHRKCMILNHNSKQIEGLCVNKECRAQNRGTCSDCLIQRIHEKDELKQQQSNQPLDANQLKNIIKTYSIYLNKQIDCIEYCLNLEQLELTEEDNEKIACFKIQELEKIDNQIIYLNEINKSISLKDYIQQYQSTNIGLFHFLLKYCKELYRITKNIDEYIQLKKELTTSSNVMKQVKFNVNDIDKFHALKKKKNCFIHKISETIYSKNQEIDEKDQLVISPQISESGKVLNNQKQYELAIQCHEQEIKYNPNNCETYYKMGDLLYDLGRFEEAILMYDKTITLNPKLYFAYYFKGSSLDNLKRYEEAILIYDKAIQLDSQSSQAYYNKGNSLYNLQKYELAIQMYDKAIQLSPKYSYAYYNKGNSLDDLQRYEEAIHMYDIAIKLNPKYSEAFNNKGISLKNLQRYEEAITMYDQAILLNPSHSQAYNNKGISLKNLQKYEEAIQMYDKAILLNPEDSQAYNNKGY